MKKTDRQKKLEAFIVSLIAEAKAEVKIEYRDTIKSINDTYLDWEFKNDIRLTEKAINNNDSALLAELHRKFTESSIEYAKSWHDEDLGIMRSGYKWESDFYRTLANICE